MKQTQLRFGTATTSLHNLTNVLPPPKPKRHRVEGVTSTAKQLQQLNLDVGQRVVGLDQCTKCGMRFQHTVDDVALHEKHCAAHQRRALKEATPAVNPASVSWAAITEGLVSSSRSPTVVQSIASITTQQRHCIDAWYAKLRRSTSKSEEEATSGPCPPLVECPLPGSLLDVLTSDALPPEAHADVSIAVVCDSVGDVDRAVGLALFAVCQKQVLVAPPTRSDDKAVDTPWLDRSCGGVEEDGERNETRSTSPEALAPLDEPELIVATCALLLLDVLLLPPDVRFVSRSQSFFGTKETAMLPAPTSVISSLVTAVEAQAVYGCVLSRDKWLFPRHSIMADVLTAEALSSVLQGSTARVLTTQIVPPYFDLSEEL